MPPTWHAQHVLLGLQCIAKLHGTVSVDISKNCKIRLLAGSCTEIYLVARLRPDLHPLRELIAFSRHYFQHHRTWKGKEEEGRKESEIECDMEMEGLKIEMNK